jgi:hypothetical protein
MRAVSAAIVLLAGVVLFGLGYMRVSFRGEDSVAVVICFLGMGVGILGLVTWLIAFFGESRSA